MINYKELYKISLEQTFRCFIVLIVSLTPAGIDIFINYINNIPVNWQDIIINYIMTGNILFVGISLIIITSSDTFVYRRKIESLNSAYIKKIIPLLKAILYVSLIIGIIIYVIIATSNQKPDSSLAFELIRNFTIFINTIGIGTNIIINTLLEGEKIYV